MDEMTLCEGDKIEIIFDGTPFMEIGYSPDCKTTVKITKNEN